jgi:glycosyltransferase involved in cell wall biosynthesis
MNVAIVYDRMNKIGGAERVLVNLHALFPDASFYTAVYDPLKAAWANGYKVHSSFLEKFPFATGNHELYMWAMQFAFETFSFEGFDVVISVTSAEAKSVITKTDTLHICYCLTPTRYLWSGAKEYTTISSLGRLSAVASWTLKTFLPIFRGLDRRASSRPDIWIAISSLVKKRIETYYQKKVHSVIYPPVDDRFFCRPLSGKKGEYFLVVSRLVGYKRIDIVIEACNKLKQKLIIIGDGREKQRLKKMAGKTIEFIDTYLTDDALVSYYEACSALLYAGEEDFGLVAAEAQALGKPVIAYKESGISEIVQDKKTGIVFRQQSVQGLMTAIQQFEAMSFSPIITREKAERFRSSNFRKKFFSTVKTIYTMYMKQNGGGVPS